jgi:pimeloyl-ACP methyl ester carboxylesterase
MPLRPGDVALPPMPDAADLRLLRRPALLLTGEHDAYCPPEDLRAYADGFPDAEVAVVAGTDHFFWRREPEAALLVGAFAERALGLEAAADEAPAD